MRFLFAKQPHEVAEPFAAANCCALTEMNGLLSNLLRKALDLVIPEPSLADCIQGANRGDPEAQSNIATYCVRGEVVPRDPERAIELLTASAEAGYPCAQHALGNAYYLGD